MKQQAGFTLIELIMVVVILGILAATAMPKFANLRSDANAASLQGLKGAMDGAANIAHGVQQIRGVASNVSVTMAGATVTMTNGYPSAGATGILAALEVDATKFYWLNVSGIAMSGADGTNCYVPYTAAAADNTPATTGTIDSDGC